jgi:hypothetical protein
MYYLLPSMIATSSSGTPAPPFSTGGKITFWIKSFSVAVSKFTATLAVFDRQT